MFLLSHNIKTAKLINKLKNKMLSSFKIKTSIKKLYKLKLIIIIKMYDVFYFNLLYKNA